MKLAAIVLLAACLLATASAQTSTYGLKLIGSEQSPAVDTEAYALATISFNTDSNNITYNLTFSEVPFPTAAHIHVNAGPGENGSVAIPLWMAVFAPLPDSPPVTGQVASNVITPATFAGPLEVLPDYTNVDVQMVLSEYIQNDRAYVQVHTQEYPDGFIRANFYANTSSPGVSVVPAMEPEVILA